MNDFKSLIMLVVNDQKDIANHISGVETKGAEKEIVMPKFLKKVLKNPKVGAAVASVLDNKDVNHSNNNMDKKPAAVIKKPAATKKVVVKKPA